MPHRAQQRKRFLKSQALGRAEVSKVAGDASFRSYYRVSDTNGANVILMDAPPEHENLDAFIKVDEFLCAHGLKAPAIYAVDKESGFMLLEDLGDALFNPVLRKNPEREEMLYGAALDVLRHLHTLKTPDLPPYDEAVLKREVSLFIDWYIPHAGLTLPPQATQEYYSVWENLYADCIPDRPVTVLRDYHADNLLWLPENKGLARVGLLDFQDALLGHPAYDLVSLLEDARRDVALPLRNHMVARFLETNKHLESNSFRQSYAVLGAQRNLKIIGIFCRLAVRDSKPAYLAFLPRVWHYLTQDLKHPRLTQLNDWMEKHIVSYERHDQKSA